MASLSEIVLQARTKTHVKKPRNHHDYGAFVSLTQFMTMTGGGLWT